MSAHPVRGYVNFPVDRPSTGEPGTFVRLVVVDEREWADPPAGWRDSPEIWNAWQERTDRRWALCSGVSFSTSMRETFLGDDFHGSDEGSAAAELPVPTLYHHPWIDRPSPEVGDAEGLDPRNCESIDYLAVIALGSSRWASEESWLCTVDDLTSEGVALYRAIEALYPGCRLVLQTWLDT